MTKLRMGVCTTSESCDDHDPCTVDKCDPALGCTNTPVADGTSCSDGNACNGAETCQAGTCTAGTPPVCDDANVCTLDSCDPAVGCLNLNAPAGTACSDGDVCTVQDVCMEGLCQAGQCSACRAVHATGAGQVVAATGGLAQFRFNIRAGNDGRPNGTFSWTNRDLRCSVSGEAARVVVCPDASATIQGSCGSGCEFVVTIREGASPASADAISVTISGGCTGTAGEQQVVHGQIQIR